MHFSLSYRYLDCLDHGRRCGRREQPPQYHAHKIGRIEATADIGFQVSEEVTDGVFK